MSPQTRAPYASDPARTRGRRHAGKEDVTRTAFQRDRDRVVHADAFRRLKDKTQVFLYDEGDHYRTRLTHSLEVAQVTRSIARALALDEDLAEALALAHDLGHPPFGHAGERALAAAMADYGGFDHNAQSLRVVTALERRYPGFDGLNLTWETLEGLVKHNGPCTGRDLPFAIVDYVERGGFDLELTSFAGPEAQIAALSDDIAYDAHDIDDGLRAGLLSFDDLGDVALAGDLLADIGRDHPGLDPERVRADLVRRLIAAMIGDVVAESTRRLRDLAPASVEDVRGAPGPVIAFSAGMAAAEDAIKTALRARVYRHARVKAVMSAAEGVVTRLFRTMLADPGAVPEALRIDSGDDGDDRARARRIADVIAGMTDRYALAAYRGLFGEEPLAGWPRTAN